MKYWHYAVLRKNYQSYRAVRKENEEWQIAKRLVAAILQEEIHQEEEQQRLYCTHKYGHFKRVRQQ